MALVQRNYLEGNYIDRNCFQKQIPPEFYFLKSEISNSKFSSDYTDYPNIYEPQAYRYIDEDNKPGCFEGKTGEILLNKSNMTIQDPLSSSLVLIDTYSSKNHIFPSSDIQSGGFDTSLMMQNVIDPQLFSEKNIQNMPSISHKMQLLSPPYSSMQYDKNLVSNFTQNSCEKPNQEDLRFLIDHCSQLQVDFKDSIHQLSSQIFSPPMSPEDNTIVNLGDLSQNNTSFEKPFNQILVTMPFNDKKQHDVPSSNEVLEKSTTFGRFSSRRTMISLEAISSFIQGPEESDGKFVCLYNGCLKRFGRKYNIQSHIQTHLSDRPYCCPICRARFVRHHDLKRHVKIHGDQKPYSCPCGKSFVRTDALKRHRVRGICKGSILCQGKDM
ncbi:unnamed protein product [Pneumocystis jirovecii]|uniref:C2H2-type domain-containing protein n=2 Tax=Pneumocystis jirovecii TaxID=42068 RepID=L0PG94_PNEJI|nr:uncharacterized protein T551_00927 [Pneumocystis jirovecii RU7]KTW31666.1 hypothetical protein T551_00927 [Pneumocystis jirovecii RU7]CCJ31267.1 unnamed protein product [Pneumocystis jirovecii]